MMATPAPSDSRASSPLSSLASQSPATPAYLPSPASQVLSDTCLPPLELGSLTRLLGADKPCLPRKRKDRSAESVEAAIPTHEIDRSPTARNSNGTQATLNLDGLTRVDGAGASPLTKKRKVEPSLCLAARTDDAPCLPPTKKRRVKKPEGRTTRYLDLRSGSLGTSEGREASSVEEQLQLDRLLKVLRNKRKIVVVAGAGISVSAGIPDFRSSTGLFSTSRSQNAVKTSGKHLFDASVYKTDAATSSFHDMVRSLAHLAECAKPTAFHHLLASLAQEGRLLRLYTQNVDGLETSLPPLATNVPLNTKAPWPRTIQLHGGLGKMVCQKCNHLSGFQASLFEGPEPPSCQECETLDSVRTNIAGKRSHGVGKLRPRIVLYNEYNPDEEAIGAVAKLDLRNRPDAVIVVGTSLKVRGVRRMVREMCGVVRSRKDGVTIWINNGPEPIGKEFENCWDLVVRGESDCVAHLANLRNWDDTSPGGGEEIDEAEWARVQGRESPKVILDSPRKPKGAMQVQGVLTPVGTPTSKSSTVNEVEKSISQPEFKPKLPGKQPKTQKKELASNGSKPKRNQEVAKLPAKNRVAKKVPASKGASKINSVFKMTKVGTSKTKTTIGSAKPGLNSALETARVELGDAISADVSIAPNPTLCDTGD